MAAHNFIDLAGRQVGRLSVIALADERGSHGEAKWRCRCECGSDTVVLGQKLRTGYTKSCGCLKNRSGSENPNADNRPILERIAERSHVVLATGCKIWGGSKNGFGHGHIKVGGRFVPTHRAAWEAEKGPIRDGLDCLHNCPGGDNPACWNVDHLWLGTQADNNADRDRKGRHVPLPGEMHGGARLTDEQIAAMRTDTRPYVEIAEAYGMSEAHVGNIMRGDNWAHLPGAVSRKRGDRHCHAKLTSEDVRAIRADRRAGRAIAADFGVSPSNVYRIRRGEGWSHVT